MTALSTFLDESLAHLCNRATAQERSSFHLLEAYRPKDGVKPKSSLYWPEVDAFDANKRALPPAEHMVMIAWRYHAAQLAWIRTNGLGVISLGSGPGAWRFQTELSGVRHLLLHSVASSLSTGMWRVKTLGCRILGDGDLVTMGYPFMRSGGMHAVFDVETDPHWAGAQWGARDLIRSIRDFEASIRYKLVRNVGRQSLFPRIAPLALLINTMKP